MTVSSSAPQTLRGSGPADQALRARARQVVPGGMWGHLSVEANQLPANYPQFFASGEGPRVRDVDGHEYLDLMCAWGPMLIGYRNPKVEAAVRAQLDRGDTLNGPSARMVELAELLVNTVAHADWAVFAKNGTDATSTSCAIARAATGRRKILKATTSYHGANAQFNPFVNGTTPEDRAHIVEFAYNDLASLEAAAARHEGDVAAVIVTPFFHDGFGDLAAVDPAFARGVRALCDRLGAALILDEVRTGFRLDAAGSWEPLGVRPDLSAFSKALANGHALAAVTGVDALRDAVTKIYLTGSFWAQAAPMAAGIATVQEVVATDAVAAMRTLGEQLADGMRQQAAAAGVGFVASGHPAMPKIRFTDDVDSIDRATQFCFTALEHGAYLHPWHNWFLSSAHTPDTIAQVLAATEAGFQAVRDRF
ncbi:aminotransferase class III-fold pyridoxal phosphate-dependent enzyme [Kineosporia sp. J2-2]|uniref:Aminotransferase class III-fold pyridoxal phosphate-dependent enzyme n=1 Tax=Kineosporia corallincola TaxID=2835133 RepID=A0ABS5TKD9_9ACTN|nr:aminotransferase class III-fold pyridoxal phosphate-dependent enzyme [Kineosporia corallincola]MBT0771546.1 aminotransferase class III-fold pyridoxal phosphate-dependent enzyme [Kineosporia corallincola]